MIERALRALVRVKDRMLRRRAIIAYCDGYDEEADIRERLADLDDVENFDEDADGEPLTWAEQKNIRKEYRRYRTWLALRTKVPKGLEDLS